MTQKLLLALRPAQESCGSWKQGQAKGKTSGSHGNYYEDGCLYLGGPGSRPGQSIEDLW
jgi:hypothetical protein